MTPKRTCLWLIALTVLSAVLLYLVTINQSAWYPLMRSFTAGLDFTPTLGKMFTSGEALASLLANLFFYFGPAVSIMMALPICVVCWRAMSWGRPGVRFLCYLLWSAAMAVFCFRLGIPALSTPKLLLLSCQPVFTAWLAGGLLWLMSGRVRPAAAGLGQPAL